MSTKITYNGKTTELADGYIATLPCKDLKMETDVVVEAPEGAEVSTVEEWDGSGVVIEGLIKLISFTINGTSCQAEDGMLWMDWIMTDYNTVDAFRGQISETTTISLTVNGASQILQLNGTDVKGKDAIVSGASYTSRATTGAD